jgi:hypothetical protein
MSTIQTGHENALRLVTWGFEWWLADQGESGRWTDELTA